MSEPFLAEIRVFSFNFPPKGWAFCNGQFLPINQNQALFSLLGTTYGGNGQTTFALPNLRGRVPIHRGNGHTQGEAAGSTSVTVTMQQLPQHVHPVSCSTQEANKRSPAGAITVFGREKTGAALPYRRDSAGAAAAGVGAQKLVSAGGSLPHNNMQPYLVLNFCIALQGIFPSQN